MCNQSEGPIVLSFESHTCGLRARFHLFLPHWSARHIYFAKQSSKEGALAKPVLLDPAILDYDQQQEHPGQSNHDSWKSDPWPSYGFASSSRPYISFRALGKHPIPISTMSPDDSSH